MLDDTFVSIPNPDDQFLPPIYEGPVGDAFRHIVPGFYPATATITIERLDETHDYPVTVCVFDKTSNYPSLGVRPHPDNDFAIALDPGACPLGCDIHDAHEHTAWYYVGFDGVDA